VSRELCARRDAQLPEDLPEVILSGAGADEALRGDLRILEALRREL